MVIWNWFDQQQIDDNEKRTVCGFGANDERQSNPYTSSNYLTSPTKVEGITDNPISVKTGRATSYVLISILFISINYYYYKKITKTLRIKN